MKKSRVILALLMFAVLAAGVVFAGGQQEAAVAEEGQMMIGIASQTMKEAVYRDMKAAALTRGEELGVHVEWQSCDLDPQKEIEIVANYITRGFDAIVIEPVNPVVSTEMANMCNDAGIPLVNLEAMIVSDPPPSVRITGDFVEIGRAKVREFLKDWGDGPANMVILAGTLGDNVAADLVNGYKEILADNPQITVVQEDWHKDWDRQLAMNTMQNVLARGEKVDVVIANNDGMGVGAVRAAEEAGMKEDILFYAMDHDKDAVIAMLDGAKYKTVDKTSQLQGARCVEAAVALVNGDDVTYDAVVEGIKTWYTPFEIVSIDNLRIAKEKFPDLF